MSKDFNSLLTLQSLGPGLSRNPQKCSSLSHFPAYLYELELTLLSRSLQSLPPISLPNLPYLRLQSEPPRAHFSIGTSGGAKDEARPHLPQRNELDDACSRVSTALFDGYFSGRASGSFLQTLRGPLWLRRKSSDVNAYCEAFEASAATGPASARASSIPIAWRLGSLDGRSPKIFEHRPRW